MKAMKKTKETKKKEKAKGVSIQIYLPSGDPQGIRVAEITTRTVQVFDVPRTEIGKFFELPESDRVAIYYLFGDEIEDRRIQCYIGKTNAVRKRFRNHLKNRNSWSRALIAVSSTNANTGTHVGYLEWKSIREANEAGRFAIDNGNAGSRPHTPAPLQAECEEIFDTIEILLTTLGFPLFQELATAAPKDTDIKVFCKGRGAANARGIYSSDGLTVFKDSRCAAKPTNPAKQKSIKAIKAISTRRENLLQDGALALVNDVPVFQRDTLFKSTSGASSVVLFRSSSGWRDWKTEEGDRLEVATGRASVKKEEKESGA